MSRPWSASLGAAAALLALSAALAGCGKMGELERPGPLFGHGQGVGDQPRQQQDPNRPVQTVDPRDQTATPAPPRTLPVPGQSPNPLGAPPNPGALPDPYVNPPR
jgi:predicted small lipoprotein YifL